MIRSGFASRGRCDWCSRSPKYDVGSVWVATRTTGGAGRRIPYFQVLPGKQSGIVKVKQTNHLMR
jgi:hypothetical protein